MIDRSFQTRAKKIIYYKSFAIELFLKSNRQNSPNQPFKHVKLRLLTLNHLFYMIRTAKNLLTRIYRNDLLICSLDNVPIIHMRA